MTTLISGGDLVTMRLIYASVSLLILLLLNYSPALGLPLKTDPAPSVPGELIVKLKSDASFKSKSVFLDLAQSLQKNLGIKSEIKVKTLQTTTQYAVLKFPSNLTAKAHATLSRDLRVSYAEPNYIYHSFGRAEVLPNDADFSSLWGMKNTGQAQLPAKPGGTPGPLGKADSDIHITSVWADGITGSKSVRVAIVDTGIDYHHPDLKDNVDAASGFNFITNKPDALDDQNHGTHCAGTIGALANNSVGVAGVNWNVTMIPVKFLDQNGSGTADGALQAVQYATKLGVNIMSNSWGGGGYSQALFDAINEARTKGILFVAAAGNDSNDNDGRPSYPASYALDNIISVAASDNQDKLAYFSNFGRNSVHVAAPGVSILSTVVGGNYAVMSGTSMATPHISGIAALILSSNPSLTYTGIKDAIINSCDKIRGLARKVVCGGRVNVYNAVHGITPPNSGPSESDWKDVPMTFETVHPYENGHTYTFPIQVPHAKYIRVVFAQLDTEAGYDFIHLTQANGDEIETISGTHPGYVSDYLIGDHATVSLLTDSSINRNGFSVTHVQAIY